MHYLYFCSILFKFFQYVYVIHSLAALRKIILKKRKKKKRKKRKRNDSNVLLILFVFIRLEYLLALETGKAFMSVQKPEKKI